MAPAKDQPGSEERFAVLLDREIEGRLESQVSEIRGLDSKATTLLAATGVIFGLVAGGAKDFNAANLGSQAIFCLSGLSLLAGLACGVFGLWPREVVVVPEPAALMKKYAQSTVVALSRKLAETGADAYVKNNAVACQKRTSLRAQMLALMAAAALLALAYAAKGIRL